MKIVLKIVFSALMPFFVMNVLPSLDLQNKLAVLRNHSSSLESSQICPGLHQMLQPLLQLFTCQRVLDPLSLDKLLPLTLIFSFVSSCSSMKVLQPIMKK